VLIPGDSVICVNNCGINLFLHCLIRDKIIHNTKEFTSDAKRFIIILILFVPSALHQNLNLTNTEHITKGISIILQHLFVSYAKLTVKYGP